MTVVPVILSVGALRFGLLLEWWSALTWFSLYHFYGLLTNTTTLERMEKDRAAILKRHGKLRAVSTYNIPVHVIHAVHR